MPCQITDYLYRYGSSLSGLPLASQTILAVPGADSYRIKVGSAFRMLGPNPDIPSVPLRYGIVATTDALGLWSVTLPYGDQTETHPYAPEPRWSLVFPDGRVVSGVVPADAGPLSVDDLIDSHGWSFASSVYVAPTAPGQLARGTAVFSSADSAVVLLEPPMASSAYVIKLAPSVDSVTGEVPVVGYDAKSTTGFTLRAAGSGSFSVDWEVSL